MKKKLNETIKEILMNELHDGDDDADEQNGNKIN